MAKILFFYFHIYAFNFCYLKKNITWFSHVFLSRRSIYRHKTNIGQSTSVYGCRDRRLENIIILLCAKITVRLVVTFVY